MDDGERVVALDQPESILFGEHRERERALNLFRHTFEAGQVEGLLLLNELHSDKTICLHLCSRQVLCAAQLKVVPNNAIMRQRKGLPLYTAEEGMVVVILFCTALCRHPRMSHNDMCFRWNTQMQPMRRQRTLVDLKPTRCVVGDTGGVCAARFCRDREFPNETVPLLDAQGTRIVNESEQTTHQTSPSLSTGSFTYRRRSFRYCISSGCVQPSTKLDQDMAFRSSSVR